MRQLWPTRTPEGPRSRPDRVPDRGHRPAGRVLNPRAVLLVVEIVSKINPKNDHVTKLEDYPRMGVPLYVVVDPHNGSIAVHSAPKDGPDSLRYRCSVPYGFGDVVPAGRWTFDTSGLVRYR
ncbi:Uma2 family endonuclease [Streptomyces sp. NPDC096153]|uniref:Uma2 family endonuclease n=1 Tax=Streptomyces sp. NPDC096153 TaxID=3155548 RepID=UPI00332C8245